MGLARRRRLTRADGLSPGAARPSDEENDMAAFPYRILFVRHGETAFNAEGRLQGQRDIPLNGKGREQAQRGRRSPARARGGEIARLEAADGFRRFAARAGARRRWSIARAAMGLPPGRYRLDPALMELSFGDWEGLTWAEVARAIRAA